MSDAKRGQSEVSRSGGARLGCAGCREQEVCQLCWDWEVALPEMKTPVFILPASITKTSTERVVVLITIARRMIESRHDERKDYVFTYRGNAIGKLNNSAWKRAWRLVGAPTEKGILKGVQNLRHTFGKSLRSAGVPLATRNVILGHANGDIRTHYSAAEISELIDAAEANVSRGAIETPNLMPIGQRTDKTVGRVSEIEKGLTAKIG